MKQVEPVLPHLDHRVVKRLSDLRIRARLIEPLAEVISAIETDFETHPGARKVISAHWFMILEILDAIENDEREKAIINLHSHKSLIEGHLRKEPDLQACKFHEAFQHFNDVALALVQA